MKNTHNDDYRTLLLVIICSIAVCVAGIVAIAIKSSESRDTASTALSVSTETDTLTASLPDMAAVMSADMSTMLDVTETETETTTEPTTEAPLFSDYEIEALCKMVYGEAGTSPREQKRWVAIVALNHYDRHCNGGYSLWSIVTDVNQFVGYSASHPVTDEIWGIVAEVIADYPTKTNWVDYYYFNSVGDGINNRFY